MGPEFNPEAVHDISELGYQGLVKLSDEGIERELHLSLRDEFGRHNLYRLLDADAYNEENITKIQEAVNHLAEVLFYAVNPESDVDKHTDIGEEGCDPGNP